MHFGKCCSFYVGVWRWDTKDPADLGTHLDVVGVAVSFCTTQIFVWTGQPSVQNPAQTSNSSECILTHCTTHRLRNRTQFIAFFKLISSSAVFGPATSQPSSLLYVGSTAVGAAKRHLNRMAVYRRLKKTEFVDAELSLRYWASHDNLFQFALVPLQSYENYQLAWVTEHELIAQWQTPLNYPRAMALIKKTALGFRISSKRRASLYGTFGLRLWRKLHKRMHRRNQRSRVLEN